jgi:hypothetical protein
MSGVETAIDLKKLSLLMGLDISILIRKAEEQVQQYRFGKSLQTSLSARKVKYHGNTVSFDFVSSYEDSYYY